MEELTESSVRSLESEEDCGLSDAGEGWTLVGCGRCPGRSAAPRVPPSCGVALPPSGGQEGKCSSLNALEGVFIQHQFIDTYTGHIA